MSSYLTKFIPSLTLTLTAALAPAILATPASEKDRETDRPTSASPTVPGPLPATGPLPGQALLQLHYSAVDAPTLPPSRVTIPAGDRLVARVGTAPADWPVQWAKNGEPIPGATTPFLTIDKVSPVDAGSYVATLNVPSGVPVVTQALVLAVAPLERLANLSTMATIDGGLGHAATVGFIVAGGTSGKKMIVRAIGPSLAQFGITDVLNKPLMLIWDATGNTYESSYVYPATQGALTYEQDLANSLAKVGAFPTPSGNGDIVRLMPFVPGAYTIVVTSKDLVGGKVLIEIYEVP